MTVESNAEPIVLASAATGIVSFIERSGGDIDRIFGNSGIAPDMAGSPTLKLRLGDYCRLFEEASRRTQNDNFGLWFGNQFAPRDLGLWGYAAVSSPTLGSALENLVGLFRYHQESSGMRMVPAHDGLIRLEYRIEAPEILERRQDAELSLGMFLNVIRECCGQHWAPEGSHFRASAAAALAGTRAAFDAPVYFSQPTNALAFRREILEKPMPARDLKLLATMQTCLEALGLQGGEHGLFDRIGTAIRMRLPNGAPTLDQIAAELRVSAASVQRSLAEQGLSYKDALETMRRNLARCIWSSGNCR